MIIERKGSAHLKISAPAKINLFLEILGKRPDGFHELKTVMHSVDLYDRLEIRPISGDLRLQISGRDTGSWEENLVVKAVRLFNAFLNSSHSFEIRLEKRIPVGAGLGGGSSDGAATLIGCNELTGRPLSFEELANLGAELGSDVPFFLHCGTAVCRGRGEIVESITGIPAMTFILFYPGLSISTRKVYENLNLGLTNPKMTSRLFDVIFSSGKVVDINACIFNRLEQAALQTAPELIAAREKVNQLGYSDLHLSGTGSTFFQVVGDPEVRGKEAEFFNMEHRHRAWELFLVRSSPMLSR